MFDDFPLQGAERMLCETARELVAREVAPRAAAVDRGEFPAAALRAFGEHGLLALTFPPEYGGAGASTLCYLAVMEQIARVCGSTAAVYMTQTNGALPILLGGSPEQKRRFLSPLASGAALAALAVTEPNAGSDAASIQTRARREGGAWRLDGTKMFITTGDRARYISVLARVVDATGSGTESPRRPGADLAFFVLEAGTPGLRPGKPLEKMGIRGSSTVELVLDGCLAGDDQMVGRPGDGFPLFLRCIDRSRLSAAAQAVGLARGAFERAFSHAQERRQFGRPVYEFQAVSFMLADMYARVRAARALLQEAARKLDAGTPGVALEAAMVKAFCSDAAMAVTTDAVQVLGGYGYVAEYEVERMMRDAKITQIYDGTNQVQRLVMVRELRRRWKGGVQA